MVGEVSGPAASAARGRAGIVIVRARPDPPDEAPTPSAASGLKPALRRPPALAATDDFCGSGESPSSSESESCVSRHAAASNIFFAPPLRTGIVAERESPVELCNAFLKPHLHKPNSDAVMSMR